MADLKPRYLSEAERWESIAAQMRLRFPEQYGPDFTGVYAKALAHREVMGR